MINDSQSLVRVTNKFDRELPIYDDGYGPLWIHRNSSGISGIVRAQTWEDAYEICEDEFFPPCDLTIEEIRKEYNYIRKTIKIIHPLKENGEVDYSSVRPDRLEDYSNDGLGCLKEGQFVSWKTVKTPSEEDVWANNELFQEAYGFRPNGPNKADLKANTTPGIYSKDLNGDYLKKLTPELAAELKLTVVIKNEE